MKTLSELLRRVSALPSGRRLGLGLGLGALLLLATLGPMVSGLTDSWQYAFTNLTPEDSAEAAARLKTAGIPFRAEAGGAAMAVPGSKVYEARLLLAAVGLPRGGAAGFELFDRGDLAVSEFTQKVNLRRAIEGELARTIGQLAPVRSARVHLTLGEQGLDRKEDHKASAAVVVSLQPGRLLDERELAGIRHLVASAVPGLASESVTLIDGHGTVLAISDGPGGVASSFERTLERNLEKRIVDILEPVLGAGAVVARVTASLDASEVTTTAEVVDPEATALRSERSLMKTGPILGGVAGAAPHQRPVSTGAQTSTGSQNFANTNDQGRTFDVSKTTTVTVQRAPRLRRLSAAVLIDGVDGKPRPSAEVTRLGDLARRAIGLDPVRGDQLDISSAPFIHSDEAAVPAAASMPPSRSVWLVGAAAALLVVSLLGILLFRRHGAALRAQPMLRTGPAVSELDLDRAVSDPDASMRDRARELAGKDPGRAAHVVRSWIAADAETAPEGARG